MQGVGVRKNSDGSDQVTTYQTSPIKFRDLLFKADFRRVWLIGILSGVVRWLEMLAFGVYVFDQTNSALLVAIFSLLRFLPFIVFGSITGELVDRIGPMKVIRFYLIGMIITASVLIWLSANERLEIWHLGIATLLNGLYWTTDFSARRNLLGQLAGPALLSRAMSFDAASNTMTRAVGPIFGGVLMATLGIRGILIMTLFAYLAALILALRLSTMAEKTAVATHSFTRKILEGFRFAYSNRPLLANFSVTLIFNLFGFPFTALVPVIGKETLSLAPDAVGLIAGIEGLGAILGALMVSLTRNDHHLWLTYIGGVSICLIGVAAMGLGTTTVVVCISIAIAGIGSGLFAASQVTMTYRLSPKEQRSRMFGILTICIGSAPIGFVMLGATAELIGSGPALLLMSNMGVFSLLTFWWIFSSDLRQTHAQDP
jgi:MFS family permease